MIRIGFTAAAHPGHPGRVLESHPNFYPRREDFPADGSTRRCPAFHDYTMGAFSLGIAYDMRFCVRKTADGEYWVEYDRSFTTLPEEALAHAIVMQNIQEGVAQLNLLPNWMFISDTPDVQMIIVPALGQTNPEPFRGQLNIYNWFRNTSYAFKVKVDEWVTISKNSPIFAVKFVHPEESHFVLGEIKLTPEIERHARYMEAHGILGNQTFAKWREIFKFNGKRRPAKVLQFIEDK